MSASPELRPGLYKVEFSTQLGIGCGIVTIGDGRVRGGDSAMLYSGPYKEVDGAVEATVSVSRHSPGMPSVLGVDRATLRMKGTASEAAAQLQGSVDGMPGVAFKAVLHRLGD